MGMKDNLRKVKCVKTRDPKKVLDDIVAVEVQYGCPLSDKKKNAVVGRAGRKNYAAVMVVTRTMVKAAKN